MSALGHAHLPPPPAPEATASPERARLWSYWHGSRSPTSRWYLAPMLGIVALVVALAAVAFARFPVPPGVDPGHWLSISYGFVGLPSSPDPTNHPLFYPPLLFPFLGALVVATGSPPLAASIFAILVYAAYGLSVVYVARRYLVSGPMQVALVGLGVLGGTTVQMLFWGGYPNLVGFVLMNTTLVLFLAFVRTKLAPLGVAMYALLILTYFAHDLSFVLLLATVALAAVFLLLLGKVSLRFVFARINLLGVAALLASIAAYSELTARLGIAHPSYFLANPSAYYIDEVGELFAPLARAPALVPAGPSVYLPPLPTAVALVAAPLVALLALAVVRGYVPGRVDTRLIVAAAWLSAVLAVPGGGYLVRFETDYSRFLYFLPLPFFLVVLLSTERALARWLLPTPTPAVPLGGGGLLPPRRPWQVSPARGRPTIAAGVVVAVVLGFVFASVTVPTVANNEVLGTATAHDPAFLQVAQWLKHDPAPGNVLTVSSAARWTEALTARNAYTVGPVWLLFDPWQISDAQETYWALAAQNVLVNNASALSFSGFASPQLSQAPMYTAYVEGVPFPVVRVLPGSLALNATGPGGTQDYGLTEQTTVVSGAVGSAGPEVVITYTSHVATVYETCATPRDGSATVVFRVVPLPGFSVHSLAASLSGPPSGAPNLDTDAIDSESADGSTLVVAVSGRLGEDPNRAHVATTVALTTAPRWVASVSSPHVWTAVVPDTNGSSSFTVSLRFTSTTTGHPQVALPPWLSTPTYLTNHSIGFLLWPNQSFGAVELTYYEATFGFRVVFQNAEWVVLGR